ncbi:hypothetical protein HYH02_014418 [Chlamydomonas schloesseri]|uniref:ATP-dependent (S)-NAD(P)H-hydrate dehydratase n=1 Tax=Chlamydomonas schloesseri TaxID=2026947 RepID=A0A835SMC3_9CHLO|nr:hypothetical protein HYH02_014418 [Chlamydomonas schloesseri]|eukprot:KAG2428236.1 hypothetical protein HYH02_014418 [Chlamydomonas schloesseri]
MASTAATAQAGGGGLSSTDDAAVMARFRELVPQLGGNYKGAHGKVAVIGGCLEFTGAPFFAAMSALRVGADMAYVICTPSAATAIKSYSPELMVLPYLHEASSAAAAATVAGGGGEDEVDMVAVSRAVDRILPWLQRATAVVVGPGLGDDPAVCEAGAALLHHARALGLPLVIDGSALTHIIAQRPEYAAGYANCVLTPNVAELGRIGAAVGVPLPGRMSDAWQAHAPSIAQAFGGPVIVAKGPTDLICVPSPSTSSSSSSGEQQQELRPLLECKDQGALRRCGGQGDVLAGTIAAFLCWAAKQQQQQAAAGGDGGGSKPGSGSTGGSGGLDPATTAVCVYAACKIMRAAAAEAYETWWAWTSPRSAPGGDGMALSVGLAFGLPVAAGMALLVLNDDLRLKHAVSAGELEEPAPPRRCARRELAAGGGGEQPGLQVPPYWAKVWACRGEAVRQAGFTRACLNRMGRVQPAPGVSLRDDVVLAVKPSGDGDIDSGGKSNAGSSSGPAGGGSAAASLLDAARQGNVSFELPTAEERVVYAACLGSVVAASGAIHAAWGVSGSVLAAIVAAVVAAVLVRKAAVPAWGEGGKWRP